jgi:2-dehydropantoate 2-reductase
MRHAILGPGGVGALIGAALAHSGETVVLLVRPGSIDSYPGRLRVESSILGSFEVAVPAAPILEQPVDVLWVTPKATALEPALTLAPREVVDDAVVVPLMNGIDHVDRLRERYRHVTAGAIRVESERDAAWVVHQKSPFIRVDLGPGAEEISAKLAGAGINCAVSKDERALLWEKLAVLAPLALATSALGAPLGDVRSDPVWLSRFERMQAEVVAVARAEGVDVDEAGLRAMYASVPDTMRSSMQKDVAAGREPELDAIAGPVLRAGERHRLDISATRELAALVSANRRPGGATGRTV